MLVSAVGKVSSSVFAPKSRSLLYEAEIYDAVVAEKIRNGLIQHVSVGADYESSEQVKVNVRHGLFNPELSLVAVPGIPETNIRVVERLVHMHTSVPASGVDHKPVKVIHEKLEKVGSKELLQDLQCVFCGEPGEYLVSTCTSCGDRAAGLVSAAAEFFAGFDPANGEGDFSALDIVERTGGQYSFKFNSKGVEILEEKDMDKIADKTAAKINEKLDKENRVLKNKLVEAEQSSADKQAQVERSQKYGIGIKADGAITNPKSSLAYLMSNLPILLTTSTLLIRTMCRQL